MGVHLLAVLYADTQCNECKIEFRHVMPKPAVDVNGKYECKIFSNH